ncbi:MAG: HPP family protein [Candidatus Binataceae bacterium]|nr:HPP family protein [Candidatus Binataceae bacterium]
MESDGDEDLVVDAQQRRGVARTIAFITDDGRRPIVYRALAELITIIYIAIISFIAIATGALYILFPELGALSHDVFTRPRGTWACAPVLLAITPVITGALGILVTRALPYGYFSVLLTVAGSVGVITALESPVAPAISAGLLPLVLGVTSWWYPAGITLGTVLLAAMSVLWGLIAGEFLSIPPMSSGDRLEDAIERPAVGLNWFFALITFVAAAEFVVQMTGLRFVLFPPLVVIGFEMFGHTEICPWAKRPLVLPIACFLTAAGGLAFWKLFGVSPVTAGCSMAWGIVVLRFLDLHVPPALAVALLPLVMDAPTIAYPISVGTGTLLMMLWFLAYQHFQNKFAFF